MGQKIEVDLGVLIVQEHQLVIEVVQQHGNVIVILMGDGIGIEFGVVNLKYFISLKNY